MQSTPAAPVNLGQLKKQPVDVRPRGQRQAADQPLPPVQLLRADPGETDVAAEEVPPPLPPPPPLPTKSDGVAGMSPQPAPSPLPSVEPSTLQEVSTPVKSHVTGTPTPSSPIQVIQQDTSTPVAISALDRWRMKRQKSGDGSPASGTLSSSRRRTAEPPEPDEQAALSVAASSPKQGADETPPGPNATSGAPVDLQPSTTPADDLEGAAALAPQMSPLETRNRSRVSRSPVEEPRRANTGTRRLLFGSPPKTLSAAPSQQAEVASPVDSPPASPVSRQDAVTKRATEPRSPQIVTARSRQTMDGPSTAPPEAATSPKNVPHVSVGLVDGVGEHVLSVSKGQCEPAAPQPTSGSRESPKSTQPPAAGALRAPGVPDTAAPSLRPTTTRSSSSGGVDPSEENRPRIPPRTEVAATFTQPPPVTTEKPTRTGEEEPGVAHTAQAWAARSPLRVDYAPGIRRHRLFSNGGSGIGSDAGESSAPSLPRLGGTSRRLESNTPLHQPAELPHLRPSETHLHATVEPVAHHRALDGGGIADAGAAEATREAPGPQSAEPTPVRQEVARESARPQQSSSSDQVDAEPRLRPAPLPDLSPTLIPRGKPPLMPVRRVPSQADAPTDGGKEPTVDRQGSAATHQMRRPTENDFSEPTLRFPRREVIPSDDSDDSDDIDDTKAPNPTGVGELSNSRRPATMQPTADDNELIVADITMVSPDTSAECEEGGTFGSPFGRGSTGPMALAVPASGVSGSSAPMQRRGAAGDAVFDGREMVFDSRRPGVHFSEEPASLHGYPVAHDAAPRGMSEGSTTEPRHRKETAHGHWSTAISPRSTSVDVSALSGDSIEELAEPLDRTWVTSPRGNVMPKLHTGPQDGSPHNSNTHAVDVALNSSAEPEPSPAAPICQSASLPAVTSPPDIFSLSAISLSDGTLGDSTARHLKNDSPLEVFKCIAEPVAIAPLSSGEVRRKRREREKVRDSRTASTESVAHQQWNLIGDSPPTPTQLEGSVPFDEESRTWQSQTIQLQARKPSENRRGVQTESPDVSTGFQPGCRVSGPPLTAPPSPAVPIVVCLGAAADAERAGFHFDKHGKFHRHRGRSPSEGHLLEVAKEGSAGPHHAGEKVTISTTVFPRHLVGDTAAYQSSLHIRAVGCSARAADGPRAANGCSLDFLAEVPLPSTESASREDAVADLLEEAARDAPADLTATTKQSRRIRRVLKEKERAAFLSACDRDRRDAAFGVDHRLYIEVSDDLDYSDEHEGGGREAEWDHLVDHVIASDAAQSASQPLPAKPLIDRLRRGYINPSGFLSLSASSSDSASSAINLWAASPIVHVPYISSRDHYRILDSDKKSTLSRPRSQPPQVANRSTPDRRSLAGEALDRSRRFSGRLPVNPTTPIEPLNPGTKRRSRSLPAALQLINHYGVDAPLGAAAYVKVPTGREAHQQPMPTSAAASIDEPQHSVSVGGEGETPVKLLMRSRGRPGSNGVRSTPRGEAARVGEMLSVEVAQQAEQQRQLDANMVPNASVPSRSLLTKGKSPFYYKVSSAPSLATNAVSSLMIVVPPRDTATLLSLYGGAHSMDSSAYKTITMTSPPHRGMQHPRPSFVKPPSGPDSDTDVEVVECLSPICSATSPPRCANGDCELRSTSHEHRILDAELDQLTEMAVSPAAAPLGGSEKDQSSAASLSQMEKGSTESKPSGSAPSTTSGSATADAPPSGADLAPPVRVTSGESDSHKEKREAAPRLTQVTPGECAPPEGKKQVAAAALAEQDHGPNHTSRKASPPNMQKVKPAPGADYNDREPALHVSVKVVAQPVARQPSRSRQRGTYGCVQPPPRNIWSHTTSTAGGAPPPSRCVPAKSTAAPRRRYVMSPSVTQRSPPRRHSLPAERGGLPWDPPAYRDSPSTRTFRCNERSERTGSELNNRCDGSHAGENSRCGLDPFAGANHRPRSQIGTFPFTPEVSPRRRPLHPPPPPRPLAARLPVERRRPLRPPSPDEAPLGHRAWPSASLGLLPPSRAELNEDSAPAPHDFRQVLSLDSSYGGRTVLLPSPYSRDHRLPTSTPCAPDGQPLPDRVHVTDLHALERFSCELSQILAELRRFSE